MGERNSLLSYYLNMDKTKVTAKEKSLASIQEKFVNIYGEQKTIFKDKSDKKIAEDITELPTLTLQAHHQKLLLYRNII